MEPASPIEQALAAAERAWDDGNEGKARVCARRAVALASESWLARDSIEPWSGDAMAHLRSIHQNDSVPLPVRQATERLITTISRRHSSSFTTDPIGDARVIIAFLAVTTEEHP